MHADTLKGVVDVGAVIGMPDPDPSPSKFPALWTANPRNAIVRATAGAAHQGGQIRFDVSEAGNHQQ